LQPRRATLWASAVTLLIGCCLAPVAAQSPGASPVLSAAEARRLAADAESRQDWSGAAALYEALLRKDRNNAGLRTALLRCLRRDLVARRHLDPTYEAALAQLTPSRALDVYEKVLQLVPSVYVDPYRTTLSELFASGVQEVLLALEDDAFLRRYLPTSVGSDALKEFKAQLVRLRDRRPGPVDIPDARTLVMGLSQTASDLAIPVSKAFQVALALEMAAGACNALDEYTLFLTPGSAANAALGIDVPAGVGIEVVSDGGEMVVTRVYPRGPADNRLHPNDRIRAIGGQPIAGLDASTVHDRLRGESGSIVDLEVLRDGQMMLVETIQLRRGPYVVPTVEYRLLADPMGMGTDAEPIGYLRITEFRHTTVQEVREALAQLQTQGARGVVLDLRGNGGGLFEAAVKVAELFLPAGHLVTRGVSPVPQFNRPFPVESTNPLTLPLAVLIDGETASAAEVVVAALKDNNRARLLGQPTYGKGLIQCIIPVTKPGESGRLATALKITVARFLSPDKSPVTRQGIPPHDLLDGDGETAIVAARLYLLGMLRTMNIR